MGVIHSPERRTASRDSDTSGKSAVQRQARVLRMLNCLQSGPNFNAAELAERLKVSRRTVYRDLKMIRDAGVPVHFDAEHSAYRLSANFPGDIAPPRLSSRDLAMLVLAANFSALQALPDVRLSLRESISNLLGCYGNSIRPPIARLLRTCEFHVEAPQTPSRLQDHASQILDAISRRRRVRLRLGDDPQWDQFAVYRFFLSGGAWKLYGQFLHQGSPSLFQLVDVSELEITDSSYTIPAGLRDRLRSRGVLEEAMDAVPVREDEPDAAPV